MKKSLFLLLFIFISFFYSYSINHDLKIDINSKEINKVDGKLSFELILKSFENVKLSHYLEVKSTSELQLIGNCKGKSFVHFNQNVYSGHLIKKQIQIYYNSQKIPFSYQVLKVFVKNETNHEIVASCNMYIYITPYNTVEIWNELDFENLKRLWRNSSANQVRKYVSKSQIPVSDLTNTEWDNDTLQISYITVEGLAYKVPVKFKNLSPDEEDNVVPAEELSNLQNAKINASAASSNFRTWNGNIRGNIKALVGNINIPITGIKVEVIDEDPFGFGCIGRDDHLGVTHTDNDGNFSIDVQTRQRYKGGLLNCLREGDYLELYLLITAINSDRTLKVIKGSGKNREREASFGATISWHYSQSSVDFGIALAEGKDLSSLKPHLFHWAFQCKRFVQENLPTNIFPGSDNALHIVKYPIKQDVPDRYAFFLPGVNKQTLIGSTAIHGKDVYPWSKGSSVILEADLINGDALYISENYEDIEEITFEVFGHYLLYKLNLNGWPGNFESLSYKHSTLSNDYHPRHSWARGFGVGFAMIMDAFCKRYDNEAGTGIFGSSYEDRKVNGVFPETIQYSILRNGTIQSSQFGLTHGFVSEYSIGALIYDLFDGPANLAKNNNIPSPSNDFVGTANDNIELSFLQICGPMFRNRASGFDRTPLINDIVEYHWDLIKSLDCNSRRILTDLFYYNNIKSYDNPVSHRLSRDMIFFNQRVNIERFNIEGFGVPQLSSLGNQDYFLPIDMGTLSIPFNVGSRLPVAQECLIDNLTHIATLYPERC